MDEENKGFIYNKANNKLKLCFIIYQVKISHINAIMNSYNIMCYVLLILLELIFFSLPS